MSKINKQQVPKIRFEGFSKKWVNKEISEFIQLRSETDDQSSYLIDVELENLVSNKGILIGDLTVRTQTNSVFRKGDILFGRLRPYLNKWWLADKDGVKSGEIWALYPKNQFINTFIYACVQDQKFLNFVNQTSGTKMPRANWSSVQKESIPISLDYKEQTQIGNFFQQLDKLIELQTRAVESAETYKKAMLQKMFPQKGEKAPRVRFEGFSGDWEESYLGDITDIKTGKKDVQDALEYGVYPFYIRSDEVKRIDTYSFDGEAILIPGEGRLGEIFHYINGRFDYHQRVYKISDFINVNGLFVLSFMRQNFKRHALTYTVKATVDSLRLPIIQSFLIKHPSLDEQIQIGNFFKKLDQNIEAEKKKLEKYQDMKKAMLQRMFV